MTIWTVTASGTNSGLFLLNGIQIKAALGRSGVLPEAKKREGDGATPLGRYVMRHVYYREDRGEAPTTRLPYRTIRPDDGWCDAPEDAAYNRPVRLPYPASCETLMREDALYDRIIVLGHNDDPPVSGRGSAIFLHCAKDNYAPTEGCVALARADLDDLLKQVRPGDSLDIIPG